MRRKVGGFLSDTFRNYIVKNPRTFQIIAKYIFNYIAACFCQKFLQIGVKQVENIKSTLFQNVGQFWINFRNSEVNYATNETSSHAVQYAFPGSQKSKGFLNLMFFIRKFRKVVEWFRVFEVVSKSASKCSESYKIFFF